MKQILLATTNSRELSEARDACKDFGIDVVQSELNIDEIQHHDPRKIAEHKARIHSLSPALFIRRLRMPYLLAHLNARYVWAVFVFINCLVTIALLTLLAYISGNSFVFPSLGPTAILFFMTPQAEAARPRNALTGHAIGIVCGYLALVITGLTQAPSVIDGGVTLPRIIAASLALAATGAIMVVANTPHAPAGATTLIIALGFITQPWQLLTIEAAVFFLVLQAVLINRLAGVLQGKLPGRAA